MSFPVPITSTADRKTVTSSEVDFDTTMAAGEYYVFTADTDCYIAQGSAPAASAADASVFVPAGVSVLIDGAAGAKLSVIRKSADGIATLTRAKIVL